MELNILADGKIGRRAPVFFRQSGHDAELLRGENPVGDADAHHEIRHGLPFSARAGGHALAVALRVDAPGAEVRAQPLLGDGVVALAREALDLVERLPGVLFALEALDALGLGFRYRSHCGHKMKNPPASRFLAVGWSPAGLVLVR